MATATKVRKYRALRFAAFLLQVFAWMALLAGILAAGLAVLAGFSRWFEVIAMENLLGGAAASALAGLVMGGLILLGGAGSFVAMLALSQAVYLQIDVEHNTRLTAELLRQIMRAQAAATPASLPAYPTGEEAVPALPSEPADFSAPTVTTASRPESRP